MDIVSTFKGSTDKIGAVDRIIRETGMSAVDVFVQLIECNCIDGRAFRQGRFKDDWFAAKKAVKKDSIQRAESASRSLTEEIKNLRAENEKLQNQLDNAKNSEIPESYQKTIDTQKEEIDKLNAAIEQMKDEYKASDEMNAKLQNEKSDTDALIEDLNSVVKLREDEIKELNERIEELNRKIEHLKVSDFNATADSMQLELKVKKLEEKADSYGAENIALNEQIVKLKERIRGLEEEAEVVAPEDVDAELLERIRFLEDEKEGDGLIIRNQLEKISVLENKLAIAEKYVLNQVLYGV